MDAEHSIDVGEERVSALLVRPRGARAIFALAHGAGAGMRHPFLAAVAEALARERIATLRFQFPYVEKGTKRPDREPLLAATVRAAVVTAARLAPRLPLVAGGKSMGGRITSQAAARGELRDLPRVQAIVFLGFPLHAAKKPSTVRARHLADVAQPMLFLQGTRDALAPLPALRRQLAGVGPRATLHVIAGADHGFSVLKRSGRDPADVIAELAQTTSAWLARIGVTKR